METIDCMIVGAGVVGLAIARACALAGRETVLLEAGYAIGTETSSRNSEVVHAGIYYSPGSLKAKLCVLGKVALYDYCDRHSIPYWRCGKLIVACDPSQLADLDFLEKNAQANGVSDLRWLDSADIALLEPDLCALAALESPSTGIVDSHVLMQSYLADFEAAGGVLVLRSPMLTGRVLRGRGILVRVGGPEPTEICARYLVNATGLRSAILAASIEGVPVQTTPKLSFAKGNYFALATRSPFNHLIYPIPSTGGLGVHLTLDLSGRARFGPDVEWVSWENLDYSVDPGRSSSFYQAIRRYWPGLPDGALMPDYAGVRPKLVGPDVPDSDFIIQDADIHGIDGLVCLHGIESPGLTSSLAIADEVIHRLGFA